MEQRKHYFHSQFFQENALLNYSNIYLSFTGLIKHIFKVFLIFKLAVERQRRIDNFGMKIVLVILVLTSRL